MATNGYGRDGDEGGNEVAERRCFHVVVVELASAPSIADAARQGSASPQPQTAEPCQALHGNAEHNATRCIASACRLDVPCPFAALCAQASPRRLLMPSCCLSCPCKLLGCNSDLVKRTRSVMLLSSSTRPTRPHPCSHVLAVRRLPLPLHMGPLSRATLRAHTHKHAYFSCAQQTIIQTNKFVIIV